MNDHDDLTPPPDEPMPEQARARIRADLLRAGGTDRAAESPWRRWAIPGLAAAAVLVVAGLAGWAVQAGDGSPQGGPAGGTAGSDVPPSDLPSDVPSDVPSDMPTVIPSEKATTTLPGSGSGTGSGTGTVGRGTCEEELASVLPGAQRAFAFPEDRGTTSFWVKGEQFVLCDVRSGITTVHQALPMSPSLKVETFRVSSNYVPSQEGARDIRVAGGLVPHGALAYDVSYTFPNGHTEWATTATDDQGRTWWRMVYAYPDNGGNETNAPPIEATLSLSGVQKTYRLAWGLDTCAQANHGC